MAYFLEKWPFLRNDQTNAYLKADEKISFKMTENDHHKKQTVFCKNTQIFIST